MSRGRKAALLLSAAAALAIATGSRAAHAQPTQAQGAATAVVYTLDVDSDAPELISFDALAARIASDLGAPVVRQSETPPRAAITIRYRQHELVVRAVHSGGRVLERTVTAEGDDAAIQREAVLLASNLAREEAREILDELAARPPAARPEPVPS